MTALAATEEASIKIKDATIDNTTGDGKMAVTYGGDNAQIEYQKTFDLSKANTLSFEAKNNGATAAQLNLIFKLTDAWTWTEVEGPCEVPAGEKKTCTFDISSHADRNKTLSTVIANYAAGYTGTILYDNFVAGTDTLWNFNTDKYDAFSRGFENTEEMIPEIKIVYDDTYESGTTRYFRIANNIHSSVKVNANTISLVTSTAGMLSVDIFGMNGQHVATLHRGAIAAGNHTFSLTGIRSGHYLLRIKGTGIAATQPIRLK